MIRLIVVLSLLNYASAINVVSCGGASVVVSVPACSGSPCRLARDSSNSIEIDFTLARDAVKLTTIVKGKLLGFMWMPWVGFDNDACAGKNVQCPAQAGQPLTYKHKLDISSYYPAIKTTAEFKMVDDKKKTVFCFRFPVQLV
ncbi:NPC intracellular cholesterol transporter 2 [Halotydeus destructor]|nr:NPC intracellular cholesterol transporter 2 [Halotydeus destructor]